MKTEQEIRQAFFNADMISNPKNAPNDIDKARAEERLKTLAWVLDEKLNTNL